MLVIEFCKIVTCYNLLIALDFYVYIFVLFCFPTYKENSQLFK